MIKMRPEEAVTFVLFNNPRLKFLTFCRTIKAPFEFHLLGETFDFFSRLYYTRFSWGSRGLYFAILYDRRDLLDYSGKGTEIDNFFLFC